MVGRLRLKEIASCGHGLGTGRERSKLISEMSAHQPPKSALQNASPPTLQLTEQRAFARSVLDTEAAAINRIPLDEDFDRAVELILTQTTPPQHGSVVVSGLGKSGIIGQKLSATLASTGTPSHFLHPTEAMHGDLGRLRRGDVALLLSFGGNTDEIVSLATVLRQDNLPTIAMVGQRACDLGRLATLVLTVGDIDEACPHNLAPTASTTAMLALGDALALCVSRRRDFGVEDFKRFHPGGSLGRQLMPVVEAMRFKAGVNLPLVEPTVSVEQAFTYAEQSAPGGRRAGAILVIETSGRLAGIFTDGDLRRLLLKRGAQGWREPIGQFMTRNPRHLKHDSLVRDAVQMVREFRIDEVPVVGAGGEPVGLIDVQDLVALKVIEG